MSKFSPASPRPDRRLTRRIAAALLAAAAAVPLGAQTPVQRADALLRDGRVAAAESLYFAAVSLTPRGPAARHALGRYLVERGRLRIGATLIEEARFFGGDARVAAEALAPVYAAMHDFRALAALPSSPLTAAERQRTIWLRDNPPAAAGADSAVVRLHAGAGRALGRIPVRIGDETVLARVDPSVRGIVLDTTFLRVASVKRFPATPGSSVLRTPLVVLEMRIGDLVLRNEPAAFGSEPGVRIGLDVLGRLTPTFDAAAEMLVLRRVERVRPPRGERLPTVARPDGVYLAAAGRLAPLWAPEARAALDGHRWTLHARRGEIVIE